MNSKDELWRKIKNKNKGKREVKNPEGRNVSMKKKVPTKT